MEYLIFASNFEAFDTFKAVIGSVGVVEMHLYCITYNLHLLEGHALAEESLHTISLTECLECKAFAYRLFLAWMNLLNLVWINQVFGTDDAAVWNHLGCIELLFAELSSPIAIYVTIMIRCNLYEIEWQFALLEVSAPLGNEIGKTLGVLTVRVTYIRTSLIEENTLYAIVEDRVESSVTPEKRIEEVPLEFRVLGHLHRVEVFLGVLLQVVAVEPAFYTASALVCHDQTYRNIKSLVYYLCKEVSCSRSIAYGFRINLLPFAVGII